MKKTLCILMALCLCLLLASCGSDEAALLKKSNEFYINDAADVLSYETKAVVYFNSVALNEATKAQIVVATVRDLGSERAMDYSLRLFNEWEVGDKKLDNGFLFVYGIASVPDDGDYALQTGAGTSKIISDSEVDDLLATYAEPGFARGDYDAAVLDAYKVLFERVRDYYGVNLSFMNAEALIRTGKISAADGAYTTSDEAFTGGRTEQPKKEGGISMGWIIFIILLVIVLIALFSSRRRRTGTGAGVVPVVFTSGRIRRTPPPPPRPYSPVTPPPAGGYGHRSSPLSDRPYRAAPPRAGSFGTATRPSSTHSSGLFGGFFSSSRPNTTSSSRPSSSSFTRSSRPSTGRSSSPSRSSSFGSGKSGGGRSIGGGAGRRK